MLLFMILFMCFVYPSFYWLLLKSLYFNTYLPKPQVNALVRINEPIKTRCLKIRFTNTAVKAEAWARLKQIKSGFVSLMFAQ